MVFFAMCMCHLGRIVFISYRDLKCEWNPFMMQLKQLRLPSIFNQPVLKDTMEREIRFISPTISVNNGTMTHFLCRN